MSYTIALAGNPNCGKTTLFNALTGASQRVGNWPGVTIDKKVGKIHGTDSELVDLPGIYSMSPYSPEEIVSRNFIIDEKPDALINIVDATNLERNLFLTLQLLDMGTPMVVALNMMDMVEAAGDKIDIDMWPSSPRRRLPWLTAAPAASFSRRADIPITWATGSILPRR